MSPWSPESEAVAYMRENGYYERLQQEAYDRILKDREIEQKQVCPRCNQNYRYEIIWDRFRREYYLQMAYHCPEPVILHKDAPKEKTVEEKLADLLAENLSIKEKLQKLKEIKQ